MATPKRDVCVGMCLRVLASELWSKGRTEEDNNLKEEEQSDDWNIFRKITQGDTNELTEQATIAVE